MCPSYRKGLLSKQFRKVKVVFSTSRWGCTHNMEEVLIKPVWKGESGILPSLIHFGQTWTHLANVMTWNFFTHFNEKRQSSDVQFQISCTCITASIGSVRRALTEGQTHRQTGPILYPQLLMWDGSNCPGVRLWVYKQWPSVNIDLILVLKHKSAQFLHATSQLALFELLVKCYLKVNI